MELLDIFLDIPLCQSSSLRNEFHYYLFMDEYLLVFFFFTYKRIDPRHVMELRHRPETVLIIGVNSGRKLIRRKVKNVFGDTIRSTGHVRKYIFKPPSIRKHLRGKHIGVGGEQGLVYVYVHNRCRFSPGTDF